MLSLADRTPRLVVLGLPLLAALYYAGAWMGMRLTVMPEGMVILWIPNSVVLSLLLITGGRYYLGIALIAICTEVAADLPHFSLQEALLFGVANVGEATLAFALLRKWRFDSRLATLSDVLKFLAAGPLIAALAAALLG